MANEMNTKPMSETAEAWAAVSRTPDGMYDSRVPISQYAYAMAEHSRKMEHERDAARAAVIYAECYMRHHPGCRTQTPLDDITVRHCDCGLAETWREIRSVFPNETSSSVGATEK